MIELRPPLRAVKKKGYGVYQGLKPLATTVRPPGEEGSRRINDMPADCKAVASIESSGDRANGSEFTTSAFPFLGRLWQVASVNSGEFRKGIVCIHRVYRLLPGINRAIFRTMNLNSLFRPIEKHAIQIPLRKRPRFRVTKVVLFPHRLELINKLICNSVGHAANRIMLPFEMPPHARITFGARQFNNRPT